MMKLDRPECQRCGNCCTRFGVCVTPFDIPRISKATGLKPIEFVDYIPEPKKRERTEPAIIIDGKRSLLVLKRDVNDVCVFYSSNGCITYSSRPMLCRTYPFSIKDKKLVSMKSRACEICWQPKENEEKKYMADIETYLEELRKYKKIAEDWNNKGGSFEAFLSFICKY